MSQNKKVRTTIKPDEIPQPIEIMESAIIELASGMKKLNKSRLKRSAIVTLLVRSSGINRTQIEIILNNLESLEELFLKPKKK